MPVPLAQLIRMTRFLLLCEMFEEVVVCTKNCCCQHSEVPEDRL